jgi:N-acetylglucosamine-6-phosphate deacetylase
MIVDGHHVHPAAMRAAYRAKGAGEVMLVTDAMPIVGTDAAGFALGGQWITADDGVLRGGDGTLAGSSLDMARALREAVARLGVSIADASMMASATPARFLGLGADYGTIAPGARADLVHLDEALYSQSTWIAGARV